MRKDPVLVSYKDYIKSPYWEERKRLYFSNHPHKCAVCGHPDVELHHLKYGDYGRELDKNLAALCRVHHQELHDSIGLRKNTFYQSNAIVEEMRMKWEEHRNAPLAEANQPKPTNSFADIVEKLARPIWRILGRK